MSAARQRSMSSRIFRRVKAHARMAVLFRASARPESAGLAQPAAADRTTEVVSAFPLPPEAPLPLGQVLDVPRLEFLLPTVPSSSPFTRLDADLPKAAQRSSPLEKQPVRAPAVPAALPAEERGLDEDWPRLQTILQRHREAEAAAPEPVAPPAEKTRPAGRIRKPSPPSPPAEIEPVITPPQEAAAAPSQPEEAATGAAPAEPPKPLVHRRADRTSRSAQVQREEARAQAAPPKTETPPPEFDIKEKIPKPGAVRPAGEVPPRSERQAVKPRRGEPVPPGREKTEPPASAAEPPVGSKPTVMKQPADEVSVPKKPVKTRPVQPTQPPEPAAEPPEEQPLPLQAAWPVTRRQPADVRPPGAEEKSAGTFPPFPVELPPTESISLEKVERILKSVEAGQPTDSRVEIITPRRPRPPAPPKTVQREPEPVEKSEEIEHKAAPPARKAKPKAAPVPEVIETEIGPLPSDLWGLIGQPVPQPKAEPAPPAEIKPLAAEAETQAQPAAYLVPEEDETVGEEKIAEVQRQVERADGSAGAAGETGSEISLDDLARQVYREIKRRFTIELERFRRRK